MMGSSPLVCLMYTITARGVGPIIADLSSKSIDEI